MIEIYTTSAAGDRCRRSVTDFTYECANDKNTVTIRSGKEYQTHLGFGGAFTEASAINYFRCDENTRQELVNAYFSEKGLNYNLGRIPVGSTDFSLSDYSYVKENSHTLSDFDFSHEDEKRVPFILSCLAEKPLTLFAAPWSPPAYMKTNGDVKFGGKLKEEYRLLWAEYYARFLAEMKKRGITVSYASVQNEPEAVQTWDSREVDAVEEALEIRDFLIPAFKKYNLDISFYLWDHNRDRVVARAVQSLSVKDVSKYVWGIGYHWYCCNKHENISALHELFPDKHLLLTECCVELAHDSTSGKSSLSGLWEHGERYGRQIIDDFNNYSEGYIDWNLLLDKNGGPTYVSNFCESPVMLSEEMKLVYNPCYWYIKHFSAFIDAGDKRILCAGGCDYVRATAYKNANGIITAVAMNDSDKDIPCVFDVNGRKFEWLMNAHSVITAVIK